MKKWASIIKEEWAGTYKSRKPFKSSERLPVKAGSKYEFEAEGMFVVFLNPTKKEFNEAWKASGRLGVRGLWDGKDMALWQAKVLHDDMPDKMSKYLSKSMRGRNEWMHFSLEAKYFQCNMEDEDDWTIEEGKALQKRLLKLTPYAKQKVNFGWNREF